MNVTPADARLLKLLRETNKSCFSMVQMRKAIPLLLKINYNIPDDVNQKKVRGMWSNRPLNYPVIVPFFDPNNPSSEGKAKPKKHDILPMFEHLLELYRNQDIDFQTHEVSSIPARQEIPTMIPIRERWNRINKSMESLQRKKFADYKFLQQVADVLQLRYNNVTPETVISVMEDTGFFELTLEIIIMMNLFPQHHLDKWSNYVNEASPLLPVMDYEDEVCNVHIANEEEVMSTTDIDQHLIQAAINKNSIEKKIVSSVNQYRIDFKDERDLVETRTATLFLETNMKNPTDQHDNYDKQIQCNFIGQSTDGETLSESLQTVIVESTDPFENNTLYDAESSDITTL